MRTSTEAAVRSLLVAIRELLLAEPPDEQPAWASRLEVLLQELDLPRDVDWPEPVGY